MQPDEIIAPQDPLVAGTFKLYGTPNGGLHITLHVDGEEEPRHVEVPAMALKMLGRGNPLAAFLGG